MEKKFKRRVVEYASPATVFLRYAVAVYLFLFFVIYPFYYENKFYNMGEAKWHFFRGMTFYFKPAFLRGLALPSILELAIAFLIWRIVELAVKKELKEKFQLAKISLLDKCVFIYGLLVAVSALLSPFKLNVIAPEDLSLASNSNLFMGYSGWHMGVFAQLAFVMLYFLVSRYWEYDTMWTVVYLSVSGMVYLFALLHQFRIDPLNMFDGQPINLPTDIYFLSTIGQSSWYSSYLCCLFPIGLFIFWYSEEKRARIVAGIYSVISFASLITQSSDSAFFALAAIFVTLLFFSYMENRLFVRFFECAILAVGTFLGIGLIQKAAPENAVDPGEISLFFSQHPSMWALLAVLIVIRVFAGKALAQEKLEAKKFKFIWYVVIVLLILSVVGAVVYIYLNTTGKLPENLRSDNMYLLWNAHWGNWRGADWTCTALAFLDCLRDQPLVGLFGTGSDLMWRMAYKYRADIVNQVDQQMKMVCSHNEWLNAFPNQGLLGGIAYLAIFIGAVKRLGSKAKETPELVAIVLCVTTYMAHNFYCYQQIIVTPMIFILMGMGEKIAVSGMGE
ncbi:MAG: hypothetical protein K6F39_08980, partial [Lachnospiraceae bacterium]|nr:hypothetical protein [Lachnospiraceae bacterium]